MSRNDILAIQRQHIQQYGWAITGVLPDTSDSPAPFAYTAGLTALHQPELIVAGLDPVIAATILNDLATSVRDGVRHQHGQTLTDLLVEYPAVLLDGPTTGDLHPGTAIALYGADNVRLRQIVWPDLRHRFPWDPGYQYPPEAQPLIATL